MRGVHGPLPYRISTCPPKAYGVRDGRSIVPHLRESVGEDDTTEGDGGESVLCNGTIWEHGR